MAFVTCRIKGSHGSYQNKTGCRDREWSETHAGAGTTDFDYDRGRRRRLRTFVVCAETRRVTTTEDGCRLCCNDVTTTTSRQWHDNIVTTTSTMELSWMSSSQWRRCPQHDSPDNVDTTNDVIVMTTMLTRQRCDNEQKTTDFD